jgi:hypothetical protein
VGADPPPNDVLDVVSDWSAVLERSATVSIPGHLEHAVCSFNPSHAQACPKAAVGLKILDKLANCGAELGALLAGERLTVAIKARQSLVRGHVNLDVKRT